MTDKIEQFVPAVDTEGYTKDQWREVACPDLTEEKFEHNWSEFLAMRERVNNCRRRIGGNVSRIGPVLFDPVYYGRETEINNQGERT